MSSWKTRRPHPGRTTSRHLLTVAVALATGVLAGCEDWDSRRAAEESDRDPAEDRVCGLIDQRLVTDLVDEVAYDAEAGQVTEAQKERTRNPAACTVRLEETGRVVLEVSIGEARDPEQIRQRLRGEAQERSQRYRTSPDPDQPCVIDYDGEHDEVGFGYGWRGCYPYDFDDPPTDAGVHVLHGDERAGYQLIRVNLPAGPEPTHPPNQLGLAEDIAENLASNFITHDRQRL